MKRCAIPFPDVLPALPRARSLLVGATALALLPAALAAQTADLPRPADWQVRPDRPGASADDVSFVDMPPGWHITTGESAILWNPRHGARGAFRVELESYLFDPEGRREAFGLFVGGRDLDGDGQRYLYFLVREGGEFTLGLRRGGDTADLIPWTEHGAIASFAARPADAATAHNVLALEAGADAVALFVNGREVARVPRADLPLDGAIGLRVSRGLNLHVTHLDVSPGGR